MKKFFLLGGLIILIIAGIQEFYRKKVSHVYTTTSGHIEMCLACHKEKPEKPHAREVVGCSPCHKGDPLRIEKNLAHKGLIKNPGDLRVADQTCGQPGCHPELPQRVKKSLMATNKGIILTIKKYWKEDQRKLPSTIKDLYTTKENSLGLDYIRKLCATCHLWLEKEKFSGFLKEKGGGCCACHLIKPQAKGAHPILTKKIPIKNCVRCHNRSGRIGLTYQGLYESEGYGTPFSEGERSAQELQDGRFVRNIPPDIHFKAGLVCIDCHTQEETMGDGHEYSHFEEALEVTCQTCHGGQGKTRKGNSLPRIKKKKKQWIFVDLNGKEHVLKSPDPIKCRHQVHARLSCQACHSLYAPQCFGCHIRADYRKTQLDKISKKETYGLWEEFRSYMRYKTPTLGIHKNRVVILVPG